MNSDEDIDGEDDENDEELEEEISEENDDDDLAELALKEQEVIEMVVVGSFVALYSDTDAKENFYVCKVIKSQAAATEIKDKFNHVINKGQRYFVCHYLEKEEENKRKKIVQYKYIEKTAYILPYQIFYCWVNIDEQYQMHMDEYLFLADCV